MVWRRLGRTRYARPALRAVVGGCHREFEKAVLSKQLQVLAMRDYMLRNANHMATRTKLDIVIEEGMETMGWYKAPDDCWRHNALDFCINEGHIPKKKYWRQAAHDLRMFMRHSEYINLRHSERHESTGDLPGFTLERFERMRKWVFMRPYDPRRLFFAIDAVQSPQIAALNRHDTGTRCPCEQLEPCWDHICAFQVRTEVPSRPHAEPFLMATHSTQLWDLPALHGCLAICSASDLRSKLEILATSAAGAIPKKIRYMV